MPNPVSPKTLSSLARHRHPPRHCLPERQRNDPQRGSFREVEGPPLLPPSTLLHEGICSSPLPSLFVYPSALLRMSAAACANAARRNYETRTSGAVAPSRKLPGPATPVGAGGGDTLASRSLSSGDGSLARGCTRHRVPRWRRNSGMEDDGGRSGLVGAKRSRPPRGERRQGDI